MIKHKFRQGLAAVFALSLAACSSGEHSDVVVDETSGASLAAKFPDWVRIEYIDPVTKEKYPSYRIYGYSENWPDEAFELWADCGSIETGLSSVILWPTRMRTEDQRKGTGFDEVSVAYEIESKISLPGTYPIGFDQNHIYFIEGDDFLAATTAKHFRIMFDDPFKTERVVVDFKMPKTRPFLNGFLEECDAITKANDALREKYEAQSE